jgi:hypothetical protein
MAFSFPADTPYCQPYSLYVYVLQSFGWYGVVCVKISLPSYTFFFSSLSLFSTVFSVFFVHRQHYCCEAMMYGERILIRIYIYESMCSFCATVCRSGIYVIYSSEEIMLLCVQSNNISSLSLIIRYAQRV